MANGQEEKRKGEFDWKIICSFDYTLLRGPLYWPLSVPFRLHFVEGAKLYLTDETNNVHCPLVEMRFFLIFILSTSYLY